jgi:hypothetical protein
LLLFAVSLANRLGKNSLNKKNRYIQTNGKQDPIFVKSITPNQLKRNHVTYTGCRALPLLQHQVTFVWSASTVVLL